MFSFLLLAATLSVTNAVTVDYFFGSLWPGCKAFGGGDYVKLFQEFQGTPNTTFNLPCPAYKPADGHCIHEPDCAWETLTLCAFQVANDLNTSVTFLACMDGIAEIGGDATAAGTTCAGQTGIDFSSVSSCIPSDGPTLLDAAGKKYTAAIVPEGKESFVPDVQINGVHQIPSYTEPKLKAAICAGGSGAAFC